MLICNINLFDAEQTITRIKDNEAQIIAAVPTEKVAESICAYALDNEKVHLFGQSQYVMDVRDEIYYNSRTKYNNFIEIEVN